MPFSFLYQTCPDAMQARSYSEGGADGTAGDNILAGYCKSQNCHFEGMRRGCPIDLSRPCREDSGSCRKESQLQLPQSPNVRRLFTSSQPGVEALWVKCVAGRGVASGRCVVKFAKQLFLRLGCM